MTDLDISALVEESEARAYALLVEGGSAPVRAAHGLSINHIGGAHAFMAAGVRDSMMLNRVVGLGLREPVTQAIVEELDDLYAKNGIANYAAEVAPMGKQGSLPDVLQRMGFMAFKQTTMMYRANGPLPQVTCDLYVRCVGAEYAEQFAQLCCSVFGLGEPFPELLMASFRQPRFRHWLAFDGDVPVAAAITIHIGDGVAWIGWVCTLTSHRGRGAQAALALAQLHECVDRGTRWVTLEAATGSKRRPSQSLRNYTRLGWNAAYDRMIFLRRLAV